MPVQMKSLLAVVLLLILPLHYAWAAAASYCEHESGTAAQHFGHHSHEHQTSADGDKDSGEPPFKVHSDCGICHLSCNAVAVSIASTFVIGPELFAIADPADALPSIFLEVRERPNWPCVA